MWLSLLLAAAPAVPAEKPPPPPALVEARKLGEDLRFEEALVEYQRYLTDQARPKEERAQALFELAVLHQVLKDDTNAKVRAVEAVEADPSLQLPQAAPAKHTALLEAARKFLAERVSLDVVPRPTHEPTWRVRAALRDPDRRARAVLLRHARAADGPYRSTQMNCGTAECIGDLPPPVSGATYTAWYYVEANDAGGNTLARAASPAAPLQVAVARDTPWFTNPLVWIGGAVALVGAGAIAYAVTQQ